ncbi:YceI family protein [Cellvibrio japonicus]|nr:YceI family protein [Cellvibrio japonicus]
MLCLGGASFFCWLLLSSLLSGCGYLIQPRVTTGMVNLEKGSYQLDVSHTSVLFKVGHMNLSTFVGRFNQSDAQLEFDPEHIAAAKLKAWVDINSIDVNNAELEAQLRDSSWFDATRYPQALFTTTRVQVIDANSADFTGELTLRGITQPVVLHVTFNGGGYSLLSGGYVLGFNARARIQRSRFGMNYLVPAVGDWVDIEIYAEFKQQ